MYLCSDSRFCRFAELIESTFTNIFLISVNLNMIGGSVTGIQVRINLYILYFTVKNFIIRSQLTFHKNNNRALMNA